jgi:hypothetical protein
MTPAKDAAASPSDAPAAESQSDAADDLVARLAGASISPAPAPSAAVAMSTSAAPSPLPSTPLMRSRGMAASASPAAAPPSPALEVRTRADARSFDKKVVDFETNAGVGYRASVRSACLLRPRPSALRLFAKLSLTRWVRLQLVCNFKSQTFTLTPQTPQAGTSKLVIPLWCVLEACLSVGNAGLTRAAQQRGQDVHACTVDSQDHADAERRHCDFASRSHCTA